MDPLSVCHARTCPAFVYHIHTHYLASLKSNHVLPQSSLPRHFKTDPFPQIHLSPGVIT